MWPAAEFVGTESIELWCWASGFRAAKTEMGGREGRVVVRLVAGVATQLRVREARTGAPIERFTVAYWQDCPMLPRALLEMVLPEESHPGGCCELMGVGVLDRIVVRAGGYCESEVARITERDLRSGCVTVELERPAELTVVCHGLDGDPEVSDERLIEVLTGEIGESALVPATRPRDPEATRSDRGPCVVGRGVVDATGRTLIRGLRPGKAWLRPVGWWCQPFSQGPIELRGGERAEAVVEVAEGSTVSGSLVPAESAAWIGEIRLERKDGSLRLPYPGQGALEFNGSGAFRWTGIPSGDWLVDVARVAADYRFDGNGDVTRAEVSAWTTVAELSIVEPGSITKSIDVTRLMPGSLVGRIAGADRAARTDLVQVRPVGMQNGVRWIGAAVASGADGVFAARDLPPGEYRWMLELENTAGVRTAVPLVESVAIRAGRETVQTLTIPMTRSVSVVFGREVRGRPTGQFSLSYEMASGMPAARYRIEPDGRTTVSVVVGEPFLIRTERHGFIRPKLDPAAQQETGQVEYSVNAR